MATRRIHRRRSPTTGDPQRDVVDPHEMDESGAYPLGAGSTPDPYLAINAHSCYDIVAEGPHAVSDTNPAVGEETPPPEPAPSPPPAPEPPPPEPAPAPPAVRRGE